MISLLKILSIRPPDQNAFSDATIDYRIEGEHIYFDRIDFHGDAISLRGKGEMDFQSQIELTFYAMVGRGELDLPVVKQVFRGASQQIMLIHVDGTLAEPGDPPRGPAGVNQALQQLTRRTCRIGSSRRMSIGPLGIRRQCGRIAAGPDEGVGGGTRRRRRSARSGVRCTMNGRPRPRPASASPTARTTRRPSATPTAAARGKSQPEASRRRRTPAAARSVAAERKTCSRAERMNLLRR